MVRPWTDKFIITRISISMRRFQLPLYIRTSIQARLLVTNPWWQGNNNNQRKIKQSTLVWFHRDKDGKKEPPPPKKKKKKKEEKFRPFVWKWKILIQHGPNWNNRPIFRRLLSKTDYDEYARSILHEPPSMHFAEYNGSLLRNQSQF